MLSQVMQDAINEQINLELFSSYSYLSMSSWCEHQKFVGCAHWLRLQSEEERAHAMRLHDFLIARNCRVEFKPIAQPQNDYESVIQVFEKSLSQEQAVTAVEEEKTAREVVHKFHMVADDPASLLDLDRELSGRKAEEEDT